MSADVPPRRHRHTRSAVMPSAAASSRSPQNPQNPQNSHLLSLQSHTRNSQADMNSNPSFHSAQSSQPTTPPRTPRNDNQPPSQDTSNSTAPEIGSKLRSRNKNRPKNVMTSPAALRRDRNTPPLTGAQSAGIPSSTKPINTPSTAAYAGSTFHASPAPSALPIPSFYSKSVPDSPGVKGIKAFKGAPLPTTTSTPPRTTPFIDEFQREESPLDVFFKADREEKARARSASSTKAFAAATGPFPPPIESPRSSQTPPARPNQNRAHQGDSNRISSSSMFIMELDGDRAPGTPFGPAFSTPYTERIIAARSGNEFGGSSEPLPHDSRSSLERSEALKAYLFSNQRRPPATDSAASSAHTATTCQSPAATPSGPRSAGFPNRPPMNSYPLGSDPKNSSNGPRMGGRSSGLRQEVTPTKTPTKTPDRNNNYANSPIPSRIPANTNGNDFATQYNSRTSFDAPASPYGVAPANSNSSIQLMEDSLRRILKMDSDDTPVSNIRQVPAASVSTPNNVGGRPPPMNSQA